VSDPSASTAISSNGATPGPRCGTAAERHRRHAGAAPVRQRCYPGVVPMGPDPHGDHTGVAPARRRCLTRKEGSRISLREGAFNDKEKARRQFRESDRSIGVGREPAKGPTPHPGCTGNQGRKNDGSKLVNLPAAPRVLVKGPVRKTRPPGSVRGAPGNRRPCRDPLAFLTAKKRL
jgi:hypothetical protein